MFLRGLAFVYAIAFLTFLLQGPGLLGSHGLTPIASYVAALREGGSFWDAPSVFWLDASDATQTAVGAAGLVLALVALLGGTNAVLFAALWALDQSIVQVGQDWYGFGWESLLLEAGFLAIFLCPLTTLRPLPDRFPTPTPVLWLVRWLLFRVMFGAGLIKLRGDPCWTQLTCMQWFYETQPVPNPASWYLDHAPHVVHALAALVNHVVELVVPFGLFGPRRVRRWSGAIQVAFQGLLIVGGNLAFLNWLTIVCCVPCFDDEALLGLVPARWRRRLAERTWPLPEWPEGLPRAQFVTWGLVVVVAVLSVAPTINLLSPSQAMNRAYDPLHLVNTYGAFGTVGKVRHELVFEGTDDEPGPGATWREYELACKPGDPRRPPCIVTPYHRRLDWLMWFAAMGDIDRYPWVAHLVHELLIGRPEVLRLFAVDPFPDRPPKYVRVVRWKYRFSDAGEPGWWTRTDEREWLRPVTRDDPDLKAALDAYGWTD